MFKLPKLKKALEVFPGPKNKKGPGWHNVHPGPLYSLQLIKCYTG